MVLYYKKQKQVYQSKSLHFHFESEIYQQEEIRSWASHRFRKVRESDRGRNCVYGILFDIRDDKNPKPIPNLFNVVIYKLICQSNIISFSILFSIRKHYKGSLVTFSGSFRVQFKVFLRISNGLWKVGLMIQRFSAGNGNCRSFLIKMGGDFMTLELIND